MLCKNCSDFIWDEKEQATGQHKNCISYLTAVVEELELTVLDLLAQHCTPQDLKEGEEMYLDSFATSTNADAILLMARRKKLILKDKPVGRRVFAIFPWQVKKNA